MKSTIILNIAVTAFVTCFAITSGVPGSFVFEYVDGIFH